VPNPIDIKTSAGRLFALTAGSVHEPALILLHGWPQSSAVFEPVVDRLGNDFFVLAFDLPGIGQSSARAASALKTDIAATILDAAESLGAGSILIAGLDVGGMVAFAAARDHAARIKGAVVMNTVVPGLDPWDQLLADPRVWHFAFHLIPDLPETLVAGRERSYFDFFFDFLSGRKDALSDGVREQLTNAYRTREALKAGFDWYRGMPGDAEHNAVNQAIDTPLLYIRGDADQRPIDPYLEGFSKAGVRNLHCQMIEGAGEFLAHEKPDAFVGALRDFASSELRLLEPA
jgi:pimeloyl-ACP methyl ester carboxylesterase